MITYYEMLLFLLVGGALWLFVPNLLTPLDRNRRFLRLNFRNQQIPATLGIALLLLAAGLQLLELYAHHSVGRKLFQSAAYAYLLVTLGFGLLGLLDDLFGSAEARGLRGHFRALLRGRLTTGLIKAVGGVAVGVSTTLGVLQMPVAQGVVAGLAVALFANLFNLLDLRPGRAVVPFVLTVPPVVLAVAAANPNAQPHHALIVWIAALRVMPRDRRGQAMLGDTGSNLLGGVMGLTCVLALGIGAVSGLLAALLIVHLLLERYSLSKVIERSPALRAVDRLFGVR